MKIIDRAAFLALPAGILYSKYEPCIFGPLEIKGETLPSGHDFGCQQIADAIDCTGSGNFIEKCELMEEGISASVDLDCQGRDGCFDAHQLFAVWEPADLAALIERLRVCVGAP